MPVVLPLLIIILIEAGLRVAGYGFDYTTFVPLSNRYNNLLILNPDLPKKFFSTSVAVPVPDRETFYKDKKENTFRIFVLGGSSAAGFPYIPNVSFARFLKRKLEILYPSRNIEVVNLAVTAVNSVFIADIIDDVLDQKPDLILIYAGHNEYYGAFGSASNDIAAQSAGTARFILYLRELKVYQMMAEIISSVAGILSSGEQTSSKTLMEAMVGDNIVETNSKIFNNGINNFSSNLDYILGKCNEADVQVILGELTSNLMQAPLQNIISENNKADTSFTEGMNNIKEGDYAEACKNLIAARNYDALRFRAPDKINDMLFDAAGKYNFYIVKTDSLFSSISSNGIPGYNLFTDHLHPNIEGYRMMADLYLQEIIDQNLLPGSPRKIERAVLEKLLNEDMPFTQLDSVYAAIQLEVLLNSYPFKKESNVTRIINSVELKTYADSVAMGIVLNKMTWEDAHKHLAEYYFRQGKDKEFYKELNVVIEDKPFDENLYMYAADKLFSREKYNIAGRVLVKMHKRHEGAYSSKMLGIVAYESKNYKRAINFLSRSLQFNSDDPEVYFRLSAAYFQLQDFENALENINLCLKLDPQFPNADRIYNSLKTSPQIQ